MSDRGNAFNILGKVFYREAQAVDHCFQALEDAALEDGYLPTNYCMPY